MYQVEAFIEGEMMEGREGSLTELIEDDKKRRNRTICLFDKVMVMGKWLGRVVNLSPKEHSGYRYQVVLLGEDGNPKKFMGLKDGFWQKGYRWSEEEELTRIK